MMPNNLPALLDLLAHDKALQAYLVSLEDTPPEKIALAGRNPHGVPQAWLAGQVAGRRIARDKLPTWHGDPRHAYPARVNLSQSSSEATARFKAHLMAGRAVADLCGGAGVDGYFIAPRSQSYMHLEPDAWLSGIAAHNLTLALEGFQKVGIGRAQRIECRIGLAESLTDDDLTGYDLAYIDPSRIDRAGHRTFSLAEALPDPRPLLAAGGALANLPYLLKLSPMIDLEGLEGELPDLSSVILVAVGGEVREVLALGRWPNPESSWARGRHAIDLGWGGRCFFTHDLTGGDGTGPQSGPRPWPGGLAAGLYLYEPSAAINKLGIGDELALEHGLNLIGPSGAGRGLRRYLSERLDMDWHGRVYHIDEVLEQVTRQAIESRYRHTGGVQITSAWPGDPSEVLAKRYGLKAGAGAHLMFLTDGPRRLIAEVTRVSPKCA